MTEEYQICKIPKEDIEEYAEMIFALSRGADEQVGERRRFLVNYGRDVKEIQNNMGKHLDGCFLCSNYYKECLENEAEVEKIVRAMITIERKEDEVKRFLDKKRKWGIEHSAYESPENLREYLFKKAVSFAKSKPFELSLEFERHIEGCGSCQKVYNLELEIIRETRKNLMG